MTSLQTAADRPRIPFANVCHHHAAGACCIGLVHYERVRPNVPLTPCALREGEKKKLAAVDEAKQRVYVSSRGTIHTDRQYYGEGPPLPALPPLFFFFCFFCFFSWFVFVFGFVLCVVVGGV